MQRSAVLTVRVPDGVCRTFRHACRRSGILETGGMLFGEHVADEEFRILEATVAGRGTPSQFVRALVPGLLRLERFFRRTKHDYARFNYLGEWHSHPRFPLVPSWKDDSSMREIVCDPRTGARFVILLLVTVHQNALRARGFLYEAGIGREEVSILVEAC